MDMAKHQSELFVHSQEVPWEDLGGGIRRQILGYDAHLMLVRVLSKRAR